MYKVLVTTCYDRSGGSDRGVSVHTLVLEYPNPGDAKVAADRINSTTTNRHEMGRTQTALCLFGER